jgi:hypothetical protein
MRVVPLTAALLEATAPDAGTIAERLLVDGASWCAVDDSGCPIMAGGAVPFWPGTAEVWIAQGPAAPGRERLVALLTWRYLQQLQGRFRRVQATVQAADEPAFRLLARFGFEFEGVLRAFGPGGEDHFMMARVCA